MQYTVMHDEGRFLTGDPSITSLGMRIPTSYENKNALRLLRREARAIANQLGDGWHVYDLNKQERL